MKCCICKAVVVFADGAVPFVRIYGWSRRVPLLHMYDGRETVGERDGWHDTGVGRPPHDPALTEPWLAGDISFHEHPLACVGMCAMTLLTQLDGDRWQRDDATYVEPTATTIMRSHTKSG